MAAPLFPARAVDSLAVTFDGDNLRVSAPGLHFLTGSHLEHLKDGATVVYLSQLTLFSDRYLTVLRRSPLERFAVSYDIWGEDKFSVAVAGPVPRSASNLSVAATEAWCLDSLAINASGIAPDRSLWLRLEMGIANQKDLASVLGDSGISLRNFILLLGRKPGADDAQWTREAGPLRLAALARSPARGTRNE
ncbi:MAG: hypothetical protein LAP87_25730 [Acidobacteriia bacterium]|nr:hypothetical protein [Terriglobia bacterium]